MLLYVVSRIVCITEFIPLALSQDPLFIKIESIPPAAGGAVGHLGPTSHGHTEWFTRPRTRPL